jgi:general secretion pathway protein I
MKTAHGFTLIEVLIALMILAIAVVGMLSLLSNSIHNTTYLKDRTMGEWVARNAIARVILQSNNHVSTSTQTGQISMAGTLWYWNVTVSPTPNPAILRLRATATRTPTAAPVATAMDYARGTSST